MPPFLHDADLQLLHLINRVWTNPVLDRVMTTVTDFGAWAPVMVAFAVLAFCFGRTKGRLLCLVIGLGVLLGDGVVSGNLKHWTHRLRPNESVQDVMVRELPNHHPRLLGVFQAPLVHPAKLARPGSKGKSFPSSHVVNMVSLATIALLMFGWRRAWWVAALAGLVAWSRIYCGAHWPSDVLCAVPLGMVCGWLAVFLVEKWWRRQGRKLFPKAWSAMPTLRRRVGASTVSAV
jgi:undecaprenyl-diphosphatase